MPHLKPAKAVKAKSFDDHLKTFTRSIGSAMASALALSLMSLDTFANSGDLGQAQRFFDAMRTAKGGKNFVRSAAFVKWLCFFAPVKVEGGHFVKDKGDNAIALNVEGAKAKAFWDFAPDQEILVYSNPEVFAKFLSVAKSFKNKDKVKVSADALKAIDEIVTVVIAKQTALAQAPVEPKAEVPVTPEVEATRLDQAA